MNTNMLGAEGISSSEASRIANLIKELVKGLDVTTSNFKIQSSYFREEGNTHRLDTNEKIENWNENILKKGDYFALSAWLKEAVKVKEDLCKDVLKKGFNVSDYSDEYKHYPKNELETFDLDFDYYKYNVMSEEDLAIYLTADARATHIGKFIHNFDEIRSQFDNFKPTTFRREGDKVITVTNKPLYGKDDVLAKVETLTAQHSTQDKLCNAYKASHKAWEADQKLKRASEERLFQDELRKIDRYNDEIISKHKTEFEKEKIQELENIRAMKIVIPKQYKALFDEVSAKLVD